MMWLQCRGKGWQRIKANYCVLHEIWNNVIRLDICQKFYTTVFGAKKFTQENPQIVTLFANDKTGQISIKMISALCLVEIEKKM